MSSAPEAIVTEPAFGSAGDCVADLRIPQLTTAFAALWRSGERLDTAAFLERFPGLQPSRGLLGALAYEEYCQRTAAGEQVDVASFCARFCTIEDLLLGLIHSHRLVEANVHLLGREPAADPTLAWPAPGDSFLEFTLLHELGRGSFSRVFLASQLSLGDRRVALKITSEGSHEAQTVGPLTHRNIVPVYSVGTDPVSGWTAVCMPYLGTATLSDLLRTAFSGPMGPTSARSILETARRFPAGMEPACEPDPGEQQLQGRSYVEGVLHLAAQLADALAFLHRRGVCHLDLKPSNVLLTPHGRPMLLDFNLSHDARAGMAHYGGTLTYMAPEQLARPEHRAAGGQSEGRGKGRGLLTRPADARSFPSRLRARARMLKTSGSLGLPWASPVVASHNISVGHPESMLSESTAITALPSALNATGPVAFVRVICSGSGAASHRLTKPSAVPQASVLPSGENARETISAVCLLKEARSWPVTASHSFTAPSLLPEARTLPSGVSARQVRKP
jgi:serine/threonine protein kinase